MQCNKYEAQSTFQRQIISGQNKVALIGCGCSLATEPVAEISRLWNITHVSLSISYNDLKCQVIVAWHTCRGVSRLGNTIVCCLNPKFHTRVALSVGSVLSRHDACADSDFM